MTLFALELFIRPLDFLKLCQNTETIVINVQVVPPTPCKTLVHVPGGLLGLKTPHLGVFQTFVQNVIMYVFIVVFYGAKFKFTGPNT